MPLLDKVRNSNASLTRAEFIKDRLYFDTAPSEDTQTHSLSVDDKIVYIPFFADFGPPSIAQCVTFFSLLESVLTVSKHLCKTHEKVCLYSSAHDKRANAACMICLYMMICHKKTPEEAYKPLESTYPPLTPYRDAGYGPATYMITVPDILSGFQKALDTFLFSLSNFNLTEYQHYEKVQNGDLNWITPKFIAFANPYVPNNSSFFTAAFSRRSTIVDTVRLFKQFKVKAVVRLNNKLYDRNLFIEAGIEHYDMCYPDGSNPPEQILLQFLQLCERIDGVIAVHCKAGLGRTGTLIAAYLMRKYQFTASEVIGFMRLMRPGMVVGPQQNYLKFMQPRLFKKSEEPVEFLFKDDYSVGILTRQALKNMKDSLTLAIPVQPRKETQEANGPPSPNSKEIESTKLIVTNPFATPKVSSSEKPKKKSLRQ